MWKDLHFWNCSIMPVFLDQNADAWKDKLFQQKQYCCSLNRHQRASSLLAWESYYSCSEGLNLKQCWNKAYGRICRKGKCVEREEEVLQIKQCIRNTAGGSREAGTAQVWCGFGVVPVFLINVCNLCCCLCFPTIADKSVTRTRWLLATFLSNVSC